MRQIIDELVVLLKLNAKQFDKEAAKQVQTVQQTKKKINVSAEDQERIDNSRATRVKERETRQEKERKQRDRDRAKSTRELGDSVKDVAFSIGGAVLGFETLKGAVGYLANLAGSTAALGRSSANLGMSAIGVQAWGNAIQLVGGDAKEAQDSFAALSQQMTAFKLSGAVGPLLAAAQNNGVYARDAKGGVKPLDQLLPQIVDAVNARYSRADAFNLLSAAGVSEGLYNLLSDPNRDQYLAQGKTAAFASDANVKRAQALAAKRAGFRQSVDKFTVDAIDTVTEHPIASFFNPTVNPITAGIGRFVESTTKDLYKAVFGESGTTVGVRNNNPGNLMDRSGHLRSFGSMIAGESAMSSDLDTKIDKDGLNTIRKILSKYNPKTLDKNGVDTNHLAEYIADVSKRTGFDPDAPISSREQRFMLQDAMVRHEQGKAGAAQVARAISTPGAVGGASTTNAGDTTLHIGSIQVNAPNARDANGVASGITSALYDRLPDQANVGITP